ncbi:uncharacterized protein LOC130387053 isoform X2 [Gadus chalcogrammus]|nr:uncharacterized protein LOC130387053 isoform X2 [Gadus chalcogrammus]
MTALEKLDQVANDILAAAQIDADALHTLSREDLRDLFPGPEHFRRRKSIWMVVHPVEQASSSSCAADTQQPNTPTPKYPTSENTNIKEESPAKTIQLQGFQYVIYIDSELEHVRKHYFEMKIIGRGGQCELSKELSCRLVRHTVTNMVSVVRATATEDYIKYPAKEDLQSMARRLVSYYPMLSDKLDLQRPWFKLFKRLNKRMQNIRTRGKKRRLEFGATEGEDEDDFDSSASTVIPSPSCSSIISSQEGDPQVITSTPVKQADVLGLMKRGGVAVLVAYMVRPVPAVQAPLPFSHLYLLATLRRFDLLLVMLSNKP